MVVLEQTTHSKPDTHVELKVIKCPNCGNDLHFTKRTVQVTCRCGKTYRLQASDKQ